MEEELLQNIVEKTWPGFYKRDNDDVLYAPNFVLNKDYELRIENKDDYEYPVDWWHYFECEDESKILLT